MGNIEKLESFIKKTNQYIEQYDTNRIVNFSDLKAKVLVESMSYDTKLTNNLRFVDNYTEFKDVLAEAFNNKISFESGKRILKEEDAVDDVEPLDKVALFTDLTTIEGTVSEALGTLFQYKFQYVDNPELRNALSEIRLSISDTLRKISSTVVSLGTQNDKIS